MTSRTAILSAALLASQLHGIAIAQPFSVTAPGASIPDNAPSFVQMFLPAGLDRIEQLEIEISGLSHVQPADLDIFLVNPFGTIAEMMSDQGGAIAIVNVDLTFNDAAMGLPSQAGPIVSGLYRPQGLHLGTDGGLSRLGLHGSGSDPWILIVIDDTVGGMGSFGSFTIRGVGVPEAVPAIGAWGLVILTLVGLVAGTVLFRPIDAQLG